MTVERKKLGGHGEDLAADYLAGLGYLLLERNYRWRGGEIDLVMRDALTLVFVEVRTKSVHEHGTPLDTIGYRKRRQIETTARHYLAERRISDEVHCRFDVVGISIIAGSKPLIEHIADAFFTGE